MTTYIIRRLLLMIPTVIGMTLLIFLLVAMSPGGVGAALQVSGGGQMDSGSVAQQRAYLEDRYGLDAPIMLQYVRWLGRVSPVKFGARDQFTPSGERFSKPKPVDDPPLWQWFADGLPTAEPEDAVAVPDEEELRSQIYRRSAGDYAQVRAAYLGSRTRFEIAMGDLAKDIGHPEAVEDRGQIKPKAAQRLTRSAFEAGDAELWAAAEARAADMVRDYERLLNATARSQAVFDAKMFRQAGVPIIPGLLSIAAPDLGLSFARSRPVSTLIAEALPVTLMLNLIAVPIIYIVAIPSGVLAASRQGSLLDVGLGAFYVALWSIPVVWAGVLAVGFLASKDWLGWFPVTGLHSPESETMTMLPGSVEVTLADGTTTSQFQRGYIIDTLWHLVLPVACLVYTGFAILSKQTRAAMLENFNADYVRTAKAKGVSRKDVVFRHVFRNSLLPIITMFVSIFPAMLGGSVVIERIFSVPGMGSLIIEAIGLRDRELLLANALIVGLVNMLALLLADILYAMADPRISYD
ncbi:MAG: ABC transporter permease [Phycisphaerales bacterium]|jgi:microcin C transport system permease protein